MGLLRRINWDLVQRIGHNLQYDSEINRTKLARTCRMKYVLCVEYLEWMEQLNLITVGRHVRLTEQGYRMIMTNDQRNILAE
ncbi:MAG: hypothetical protein EB829_04795 [Nitrosopumilus sp. H8]|nr:MAG: hypothetical protein EB829_04795 [Nitrosopumilus sp. H8]